MGAVQQSQRKFDDIYEDPLYDKVEIRNYIDLNSATNPKFAEVLFGQGFKANLREDHEGMIVEYLDSFTRLENNLRNMIPKYYDTDIYLCSPKERETYPMEIRLARKTNRHWGKEKKEWEECIEIKRELNIVREKLPKIMKFCKENKIMAQSSQCMTALSRVVRYDMLLQKAPLRHCEEIADEAMKDGRFVEHVDIRMMRQQNEEKTGIQV